MSEQMGELRRTCYCAEVSEKQVGKEITVTGWTNVRRDLGGLIFVDLRDRTGIVQVVFDASVAKDVFSKAESIRSEYVLAVKGLCRLRAEKEINPNMPTGTIEILAHELKILSKSDTPPFAIDQSAHVNDSIKLKYRYLDLRNPETQGKLMLRHKIAKTARDFWSDNGFLEIETPFLGRSTPEGARDYLVPSRIHKGAFYALPQSPQLYKQILMISGFDRYFQIAKCFRDEDLRANRQPEFTQIDVEMSFIESEEQIMTLAEQMIAQVYLKTKGKRLKLPFRRFTYQTAMDRFGSDKPDTRFGLELTDISDLVANSGFQVFTRAIENGGSVRLINAKGFIDEANPLISRREIDSMTDFVKGHRAKGVSWIALKPEGLHSSITKFFDQATIDKILKRAQAKTGDILFICADTNEIVYQALGALRLHLGEKGNLINKDKDDFLWVTDFPLLQYSPEEGRYVSNHHPFTAPKNEDLPLLDAAPERVRAKAYDMVINGQEAGGGSIRIHSRELQAKIFNLLGLDETQIQERFGFFINAFKYGVPPHGGIAFGLDRLAMLICRTDNIRDVIAFPKVQNASDLMTDAPSEVDDKQLSDIHILIDNTQKKDK